MNLINSDLVKTLSAVFLFCVVMAALIIYVIDTIIGKAIPTQVSDILIGAITATLPLVGVHSGVSLANGVAKDTANAVVEKVTTSPLSVQNEEVKKT